jgi:hypothetical protein
MLGVRICVSVHVRSPNLCKCACLYACMYVCVCVCICMYVYISIYIPISHQRKSVCTSPHMSVCTSPHMSVCTSPHMSECTSPHICTWHICIPDSISINILVYIHTWTHAHTTHTHITSYIYVARMYSWQHSGSWSHPSSRLPCKTKSAQNSTQSPGVCTPHRRTTTGRHVGGWVSWYVCVCVRVCACVWVYVHVGMYVHARKISVVWLVIYI